MNGVSDALASVEREESNVRLGRIQSSDHQRTEAKHRHRCRFREKGEETIQKARRRLSHEGQKGNLGGQLAVRGRRPGRVCVCVSNKSFQRSLTIFRGFEPPKRLPTKFAEFGTLRSNLLQIFHDFSTWRCR